MLSFADFEVDLSFFIDWQLADLSSVVFFAVFCCEEGTFFGIALIATVLCFGLVAVGLEFITWQVVTFPFVHLDALFFSEVLELELLTFSEKNKKNTDTISI